MSGWTWIVVAAIFIVIFVFRRRRRRRAAKPQVSVTISHASGSTLSSLGASVPNRNASRKDFWEWAETKTNLSITLSADVRLTFTGGSAARKVEEFLRTSSDLRYPERAMRLAVMMSELNIECLEVEQWRNRIVASVRSQAKSLIESQHNALELRDSDPDLLQELISTAEDDLLHEMDERPSGWRTFEELSISRPRDLQEDDLFLSYVKNDYDILIAYSQCRGRPRKAVRLHDRGFVEWTRLVEAGLALRGSDVPLESLIEVFSIVQLNEILKPTKPIRRKKDALALFTPQIVHKLPDISKIFYLKPVPAEVESSERAFSWASTHAKLILDTVRTYEAVVLALQRINGEYSYFHVYGECCKESRKAQEREPTERLPKRLPPFHIGCEARLN
jgi:hypothetical protein